MSGPAGRWAALRPSTRGLAAAGAAMLVVVVGAAVFADLLAAHPPDRASGAPYERPSAAHLLGTDDLGRAAEEMADPQIVSHGWQRPIRRHLAGPAGDGAGREGPVGGLRRRVGGPRG